MKEKDNVFLKPVMNPALRKYLSLAAVQNTKRSKGL